jgi:dTDP-4-dehydrorhamnose reductase
MKKKDNFLIIGRKSFIAVSLLNYLHKKRVNAISVSFENFIKNYKLLIKKFNFIINCTSNKNFTQKKYKSENDHDLQIANKISKSQIKLIMLSTRKVYQSKFNIKENFFIDPKCNYSKNKLITENILKKTLKNKLLILRIANTIGLPKFNKRKLHNTFIDIFFDNVKLGYIYDCKDVYKDFISVSKLSEIIFKLIKKNAYGIFNVSTGKKIYINEIVKWLNYHNKLSTKVVPLAKKLNKDNFTLNNSKLTNKIKIKISISDLKNECIKISKIFFKRHEK